MCDVYSNENRWRAGDGHGRLAVAGARRRLSPQSPQRRRWRRHPSLGAPHPARWRCRVSTSLSCCPRCPRCPAASPRGGPGLVAPPAAPLRATVTARPIAPPSPALRAQRKTAPAPSSLNLVPHLPWKEDAAVLKMTVPAAHHVRGFF